MSISRRWVIGRGLAGAAGLFGGVQAGANTDPCSPGSFRLDGGAPAASVPCIDPTALPLLQASDIQYLGHYDVRTNDRDTTYSFGLAVRRVSGEVRCIIHHYAPENKGPFAEFSLAGRAFGETITTTAAQWMLPGSGVVTDLGRHESCWWDEAAGRLWLLQAVDYPSTDEPRATDIQTFRLGPGGVIADVRRFSVEGVPDRRAYTGALSIPQVLRERFALGPYGVGLGGYTSRMAVGGGAAMGPSLYAIPDPHTLPSGATIPQSSVKVLSARGKAPRGRRMWYGYDFASLTGKGPVNYFDGGDPRSNPSTPPTFPPSSSGQWVAPDAAGSAHWVWGDQYCGGFFVSGPNKRGLVLVGNFGTGRCFYMTSAVHSDSRTAELHVFNPDHVGQISAGRRLPESLVPSVMKPLPETDKPKGGFFAAFDAVDNRLYILSNTAGGDDFTSRLYVYRVSA